jgi:micrococcal nuclease
MDPHTRISRSGDPSARLQLYGAGIRASRLALASILAALILLTVLVAPARAQDTPGVETGDGNARVGDEVFAGDGCARAGDVAAGDCDEDSGKAKAGDGDAAGGNTKTPEEPSDRPKKGGGETEPGEEPGAEEDASGITGTTGSEEPDEIMGGTTVTESTNPNVPAGDPASCPVEPPEDAPTATVARAIDGDTVELQRPVDGYDRVRLTGVDTPEMNREDGPAEPGAEEATAFTAEALEGEEVVLETGEEVEDPYGRLLAYVWIPGDAKADAEAETTRPEFFNRTLVDKGHADVMTVEPNDPYAECLTAAEEERQDEAPSTTGERQQVGGDKDENEGLLRRLRNLISSEDPAGEGPEVNEDQYDPGGTTSGPQPAETVSEEGFQEDTSNEDTVPGPVAGTTNAQYGRGAGQEPEIQEPEKQEPEIQDPEVQDEPERGSELGTNSDPTSPELADPTPAEFAPNELAASQTPQPAETETEMDAGAEVADEAQITTLPETSGVHLIQLAALPAGVLLVCSGLLAALVRGPQKTQRNDSGA